MQLKSISYRAGLTGIVLLLAVSCGKQNREDTKVSPTEIDEEAAFLAELEDLDARKPQVVPTVESPLKIDGEQIRQVGTIWVEQPPVTTDVTVINPTDKAMTITGIDATCACTHITGITENKILQPGEKWTIPVRLDPTRIAVGEFTRSIMIESLEYKPFQIQFHGIVATYFSTNGKGHKTSISLPHIDRADAPCQESITISGEGIMKGILELSLDKEEEDEFLKLTLSKLEAGQWLVRAASKKPLPFGKGFYSHTFTLKVVNPPEGVKLADIKIPVSVRIGIPISYVPSKISIGDEDFDEKGNYTFTTLIGVDIKPQQDGQTPLLSRRAFASSQRIIESIDWETFKKHFDIKKIKGVTIKTEELEYGIRLNITVTRKAFQNAMAESNAMKITTTEFDLPLPAITIIQKKK